MSKNELVSLDDTLSNLQTVRHIVAPEATDEELQFFALYCTKVNLDPIANQIHFVKRGGRPIFQTAIDGYRAIAERTGKYAGSSDPVYDEGLSQYEHIQSKRGFPRTATVTIRKIMGKQIFEISATAEWTAYAPGGNQAFMWKKMPYLMLGKVAEALALRKAFPNAFGGIYINEEMHQADDKDYEVVKETKPNIKKIEVKEGVTTGTVEVDIFKEYKEKIEAAQTKAEKLTIANQIKEDAPLFSEDELKEFKLLLSK